MAFLVVQQPHVWEVASLSHTCSSFVECGVLESLEFWQGLHVKGLHSMKMNDDPQTAAQLLLAPVFG